MFALLLAAPATAGHTQVRGPAVGEASHEEIFEGLYEGNFVGSGSNLGNGLWTVFSNGTVTARRVDDFGFTALLNMLTGSPGSADDDSWTDGTAVATARARFALFPQEFGYDMGSGYVKVLDVSGSGFDVSGFGKVQFGPRLTWLWCRCNDSDAGLVNKHCSEETTNADGLDHMVTYHITGAPGELSTSTVWLVLWEDLNGAFGDNSHPDNQGIPADRDFNDLAIEIVVQECLVDEDCDDGGGCRIGTCNADGVCEYTIAPAGTPCGDSSPEGLCDNPDVCDQAGNCMPNYEPASTECRPASGFREWDLKDFQRFQLCFTGVGGSAGIGCGVFDFDSDSLVDWGDWVEFVPALSGPGGSQDLDGSDGATAECDRPEFCTGDSPFCPPDEFAPPTTECRATGGDCDVPELCTGLSPYCPPDQVDPSGIVCRGAAGSCDLPEVCDGSSKSCPSDRVKPSGTSCPDDGNACTDDACNGVSASCTHADNGLCGACCHVDGQCTDDMTAEACEAASGVFVGTGSACQGDGNDDGVDDACPIDGRIPTVSEWGVIIMALLLLTGGKIFFGRRRPVSPH